MALAIATTSVFSQEQGKVRFNLNFSFPSARGEGFGFGMGFYDIQLAYNLQDNMNIGVKAGYGGLVKSSLYSSDDGFAMVMNAYTLGAFTYYFNLGGSFAPFVGVGLGPYYTCLDHHYANQRKNVEIESGTKFGGVLTGGFEWGRFRFGLEYNFVPGTALKIGNSIAPDLSIDNSYFAICFGFYLGGGRWYAKWDQRRW